jgi:hypothetical protein
MPVYSQEPQSREQQLEQENKKLRADNAEKDRQLEEARRPTPEQVLKHYTDLFANGAKSTAAQGCRAAKGKQFSVVVLEGKLAVLCTFNAR